MLANGVAVYPMYTLWANVFKSSRILPLITVGSSSSSVPTGRVFTDAKSASSSMTNVGTPGIGPWGPRCRDLAQLVRFRRDPTHSS